MLMSVPPASISLHPPPSTLHSGFTTMLGRHFLSSCAVSLTAATAFLMPVASAADWQSFRAASRTAVSPETGLLQEWPSSGPPLVWKSENTGRGYASIAVVDGRIFTLGDGVTGAPDKDEYLLCLNAQDGKVLWQTKTGSPWNEGSADWQG